MVSTEHRGSNEVTGISINSGSYISTDGGISWFGSNGINNNLMQSLHSESIFILIVSA